MGEYDIAALVNGCIGGDDGAKAQFYADHVGIVRRAIARKLRGIAGVGNSDVDDLTNELFLRLFDDDCRMLRRLHRPQSVYAWLVTVAQHLAIDNLRRRNLHARVTNELQSTLPQHAPPVSASVVASEKKELVRQCLLQLEALDRLVIELYYLQGLTYAEISGILSLNPNTVAARIRRAKGKLREILGDLRGEGLV